MQTCSWLQEEKLLRSPSMTPHVTPVMRFLWNDSCRIWKIIWKTKVFTWAPGKPGAPGEPSEPFGPVVPSLPAEETACFVRKNEINDMDFYKLWRSHPALTVSACYSDCIITAWPGSRLHIHLSALWLLLFQGSCSWMELHQALTLITASGQLKDCVLQTWPCPLLLLKAKSLVFPIVLLETRYFTRHAILALRPRRARKTRHPRKIAAICTHKGFIT